MKKTALKFLFIFLLLIFILAIYIASRKQSSKLNFPKIQTANKNINIPKHPLVFFDHDNFYSAIAQAKTTYKSFNYHIVGGITPHHLFAGFILADFYNRLSQQKPKTIILIGPNHYERGHFKVLTSLYGWETPFGTVEPQITLINDLVAKNLAMVDEQTLPSDHAVAGSMSFIKNYVPDAKVVPLLLSGTLAQDEANSLVDFLKTQISNDTVIVAPVDFSHYLTSPQAQEKDKITQDALENFNYPQIYTFNNDYLDSPPSIVTLLMVMQKLGKTHMDILNHTNSGILQNNDSIQTTSYFEIAYF